MADAAIMSGKWNLGDDGVRAYFFVPGIVVSGGLMV